MEHITEAFIITNGEVVVDESSLNKCWNIFFGPEDEPLTLIAKHIFFDGVKKNLINENNEAALFLDTRAWRIPIKENLFTAAIITPLLAALLIHFGVDQIADTVLPTVLQVLVTVKHIELTRKDETILAELHLKKFKNKYISVEEWYEKLPVKVRKNVNQLDFEQFIHDLVQAGFAKQHEEKIKIFKKGKHKFKLVFK